MKVKEFKQWYLLELEALKGKMSEKKMSSTKSTKTRLLDKRAVGSFYSNLSEAKSDSQEIKSLANFLNGAMKNWRGMILRAVLH